MLLPPPKPDAPDFPNMLPAKPATDEPISNPTTLAGHVRGAVGMRCEARRNEGDWLIGTIIEACHAGAFVRPDNGDRPFGCDWTAINLKAAPPAEPMRANFHRYPNLATTATANIDFTA